MTKTPKKGKDARPKEAKSKRQRENTRDVKTPQLGKKSMARRRKSSSAEPTAAGELFPVLFVG